MISNLAALAAAAHESLPEAKAQRYQPNFAYLLDNLRNRWFRWLLGQCNAHDILDLLGLFKAPTRL